MGQLNRGHVADSCDVNRHADETCTLSLVERAELALRSGDGGLDPTEARELVDALKHEKEWWWSRRILEAARDRASSADLAWIRHEHAPCTYKDPDLRREDALAEALDALGVAGAQPADVQDAETAGLAGFTHPSWRRIKRAHLPAVVPSTS